MTIATFINYTENPLTLVIEPWDDRHEIPPKGEGGIKYQLKADAEDRSASAISNGEIEFWCNTEDYEVDIVPPSSRDLLFEELCVGLGFCGSPAGHVDDFVPKTGTVNATEFSQAAFLAEGEEPNSKSEKDLRLHGKIQSLFVKYFGNDAVLAEKLHEITPRPFDKLENENGN